jgi:hypothetical protein
LTEPRRDKAAAKRFFKRVLRSSPVPRKIVTDQLRSYPAAKAEIPELANVKHVFVKAAARLNNRAENSHQPTRERERRMRGFRDPKRTRKFLSCFGPIRQHFALKRHLLRASLLSQTAPCPICRLARIYRDHPNLWPPSFLQPRSLMLWLACSNLSGVILEKDSPRHDENRA